MKLNKLSSLTTISAILLIALPTLFFYFNQPKINTNILELLPDYGDSSQTSQTIKQFTNRLSANHLFLLKGNNWQELTKSAELFQKSLEDSQLFDKIIAKQETSGFKQWHDFYFPNRFSLLTSQSKELLLQEKFEMFLQGKIKKLYSPQSSFYSSFLENDPLMLFADYLQELPIPNDLTLKDGWLHKTHNENIYLLINASFSESVFSSQVQEKFRQILNQFEKSNPNIELLQLGFFPYAEKARTQAEWEISFIGTGSLIGILLLFLLAFRSVKQLIISIITISLAIVWGFFITQFICGSVHIITLVFGATLTGVCIDYSFHWLCQSFEMEKTSSTKKGIIWGALTSLIAYGTLSFTHFPGLLQIAIFSSTGIIISIFIVLSYYPQIITINKIAPPKLLRHSINFSSLTAKMTLTATFIFGFIGLFFITSNDDIRLLQNRPQQLVDKENEIRQILNSFSQSQFILVQTNTNEDFLATEKKVLSAIKDHCKPLALAQFLPSNEEKNLHFSLIKKLIFSPEFANYCQTLDFANDVITSTKQKINEYENTQLSQPINFANIPLFSHLYLATEKHHSSIILLENIKDEVTLKNLVNAIPNAHYINQVKATSEVMKKIRLDAAKITLLAYSIIYIILIISFSWKKATAIILPPTLAALITLGIISLLGLPLNLFNTLAFMLILGIGIDYSIFTNFSGKSNLSTNIAITLSTISTLLAFGLLGLSATPALQSFGITISLGITLSFIFAFCQFNPKGSG